MIVFNNDYKKNTTNYEERIVAFVDILGFSELVSNSSSDSEEYEKIKHALDTINRVKKESYGTSAKVTTFSDSIVISYPINEKDPLFYILIDLVHLQLELLQQGVLVRGGIAKGKIRHIQEMVFGPAMVAAYELESKYAVYPRIIVEKELVDWEKENYKKQIYGAQYDINDLESILKRDDYNDIYFIDILRQGQEFDYNQYYEDLLFSVNSIIKKGLKNKNKAVKMKYIWLKNYYNEVLLTYPHLNHLLIDNEESENIYIKNNIHSK